MGEERTSTWYDGYYRNSAFYRLAPRVAPWWMLWEATLRWLNPMPKGIVYDLGCGPGHLAEAMWEDGSQHDYVGYDFSPVAIQQARARLAAADGTCPYECVERDIVSMWPIELSIPRTEPPLAYVVACEFLEHIASDEAVLASVPAGTRVFLTVPSFDSPGHVRHFRSAAEVERRYGPFLSGTRSGGRPLAVRIGDHHWCISGWSRGGLAGEADQ